MHVFRSLPIFWREHSDQAILAMFSIRFLNLAIIQHPNTRKYAKASSWIHLIMSSTRMSKERTEQSAVWFQCSKSIKECGCIKGKVDLQLGQHPSSNSTGMARSAMSTVKTQECGR